MFSVCLKSSELSLDDTPKRITRGPGGGGTPKKIG